MVDLKQMVTEFHEVFGLPVRDVVTLSPEDIKLRALLILEEVKETLDALNQHDAVEVADGLADLLYVTMGAALTFGIDIDAVLTEVHRSNMAKANDDGTVNRREDGKILKPGGWTAPDIAPLLNFASTR